MFKNTGTRDVKFGPRKKARYLKALAEGKRRGTAASEAGVSLETVRLHRKADDAFAREEADAEMLANENVEDALYMAATAGNVVACQVWLYNRDPDRWKDMRKHELSGPNDGAIPLAMIDAIMADET